MKDPDTGEPVETSPAQMWDRVARAIAAEEKPEDREYWEGRFRKALQDFKFVPGGRILAGAGTGHGVTFYNCMPPDQEVLTPEGYRPIGLLRVGDQVITHRGRPRTITHVFSRETEETVYHIRAAKLGFDDLRLTGEHPVLALRAEWVDKQGGRGGITVRREPEWIPARELRVGDYVAAGYRACTNDNFHYEVDMDDYIRRPSGADDDGGPAGETRGKTSLATKVKVDEDFMLLVGHYLGGGSLVHRPDGQGPAGIQFTIPDRQIQWAGQVARIIEEKFGVQPVQWLVDEQRAVKVAAFSETLGQFFSSYCGGRFKPGRIPQDLYTLPNHLTMALLRGLFRSAGSASVQGRQKTIGLRLADRELAVQAHQLLLKNGYFFSISETAGVGRGGCRLTAGPGEAALLFEDFFGKTVSTLGHNRKHYFEYGGHKWVRIRAIEEEHYTGTVFDLEVEEDHSFVSAGIVVSNCYVIPSPEDSRKGILDNVALMVEIMSRGGGVGVNLSSLRPRGTFVKGVNGTASGPVSWAEVYSTATGSVIQGGSRRGALMLMLDDDHPDVEEFINVKRDLSKITNANLSVCVSDRFMEAVKQDADWELKWGGKVYKTIRARDLWDSICQAAWASGEPGVVFMERYQKWSNTWYCEEIRCVNPCGEQGLGPWGVCNLGAINLAAFVHDGQVDWEGLKETTRIATRFLDNVIEATEYFFPENEQVQRFGIRRTGLGTMGLADALIKLGIRYGSQEAIELTERFFRTMRDEAYRTSALLAAEKGPAPAFDREKYMQGVFIRRLPQDIQNLIQQHGIRNLVLLTQAPTGTTSLLAGVTSGIEPVFAFSFVRKDRTGTHVVYHDLYKEWREANPGAEPPDYFVTADQLTPQEHVRMQAAVQKYVDSSISKTVNAPRDHTVEEVKTLYTLAYELGCKGVTYFRDGCRDAVLTKLEDDEPKEAAGEEKAAQGAAAGAAAAPVGVNAGTGDGPLRVNGTWGQIRPIPRPAQLRGVTMRRETPLGNLYLTLNTYHGRPFEMFAQIGKAGSDVTAFTEAIARLVSLAFRCGVDPKEVIDQLSAIGGSRTVGFGIHRVRSVPDAMAIALSEYLAGGGPADGEGQTSLFTDGAGETAGREGDQGAAAGDRGAVATAAQGGGQAPGQANAQGQANANAAGPAVGMEMEEIIGGNGHGPTASFNLCPDCGSYAFVYQEGCATCLACGHSEC